MKNYDVLIIGGGAAGLSAALVLTRARRRVLVVDSGAPRNAPAAHMHGFLSRDGMPPADLIALGRAEVESYGGIIVCSTVDDLLAADQGFDGGPSIGGFNARLGDGTRVHARRVLVATGMHDELPQVPGLRERWARDVLHCPYCHGYEVRDQRLGVLWNGPGTPDYAQIVRQWSDDVVLFVPRDVLTPSQRTRLVARAIGIVESAVTGLTVVDDTLSSVTLEGGREVHRDALFVPPTFCAHSSLLTQLGAATDDAGWVTTGKSGDTSVSGVWAAGNVTNPRAQVITAAGEGSAAAIAINADLVAEDVRSAIEQVGPRPGPITDHRPGSAGMAASPDTTEGDTMSTSSSPTSRATSPTATPRVGPPSKHALALMIWLCVFPTLTVINLALGDWLKTMSPVLRTFILATVAVPIVIYGLMPQLHRVRSRLVMRTARS